MQDIVDADYISYFEVCQIISYLIQDEHREQKAKFKYEHRNGHRIGLFI